MASSEVIARVATVFSRALDLQVRPDEVRAAIQGTELQSLQFVKLVVGLEEEFGIELPDEHLLELRRNLDVDDVAELVSSCLAANSP